VLARSRRAAAHVGQDRQLHNAEKPYASGVGLKIVIGKYTVGLGWLGADGAVWLDRLGLC
jgi:hypothetical protein